MRRLTAMLLLGFAIVGNLAPLAWAAATMEHRACCVRKTLHRCHDSEDTQSPKTSFRATDCCSRDCCRAVTTVQWAQPQSSTRTAFSPNAETRIAAFYSSIPPARSSRSQSTRAPPFC
jgi:hypothetical protein